MKTINELLNSRAFQSFEESTLGNDLFINDPERANRIHDEAEKGGDGSTHAEHIQDWRDFLGTLKVIDPEYPEGGGDISEEDLETLTADIDSCEEWHVVKGSLNEVIG